MARLGQTQGDNLRPLFLQLEAVAKSPLHAIAAQLRPLVEFVARSIVSGESQGQSINELVRYTTHVLNRLPKSFGERFGFDAFQIDATRADVGQDNFSGMLIPSYEQDWGHESVMMPAEDGKYNLIHLILMPGQDNIVDVNLLSYPWLGHELAHNLLLRHDAMLCTCVSRELDKEVQKLKVGAMADRGTAHTKATRVAEEFARFWTPTADHKNWPHEIAADCIALWIFGPAYLACFEDVLDAALLNPYELTQSHPPYSVRVTALLEGARMLGWKDAGLMKLMEGWTDSKWRRSVSVRESHLSKGRS